MTNQIIPYKADADKPPVTFQFDGQANIRVIKGEDGEPWFVASDVCTALSISANATRRLEDDEKGLHSMQTPGGMQSVSVVNESGLYALIGSSRKPEAKAFKRWINHDVLPSIRKTGQYNLQVLSPLDQLKMTVSILEQQQQQLARLDHRVEHIEATYEAEQGAPQMMTVAAYTKWKNLRLSDGEISGMGRKATAYSNANGYPIEKAPHKKYGIVNLYHVDVLKLMFSQRTLFEQGK